MKLSANFSTETLQARRHWQEIFQITGGKHKAHRPNPALHLVLSGPAPCFCPAAAPGSLPLVKEWLHLYSLKVHLAL